MPRFARLMLVVCLGLLLTGGCPVASPLSGGGGSSPAGTTGSTGTPAGSGTAPTDTLATQFPTCTQVADPAAWLAEVLQLVNQERTSRGLPALSQNSTLDSQAEQYACELIHYGFFDHTNPATGTTVADRANQFGYAYLALGENIAAGQQSPTEAMQSWMNSSGHRANILSPQFTEIGIGVRNGGQYGTYWVQVFGKPQ